MPRGYPSLDENQKQEIIFKVRDKAEKVPDIAKEYGVSTKIIYNLLRRQVITPNPFRSAIILLDSWVIS